MEEKISKQKIGLIVVLLIAGSIGWFIYNDIKGFTPSSDDANKDIDGIAVSRPGELAIGGIPTVGQDVPDLNREVVIPDYYPSEAANILRSKIEKMVEAVKAENTFGNWLDLGNVRGQIDDYEGAREIYEYLNTVVPTNSLSFTNLGSLYHLQLRDFQKSEESFRQAITNDPTKVIPYINFHELYKFSYKQDTALAPDILKEGLVNLPNHIDLLTLLGAYYRDTDDIESARKYFGLAQKQADVLGNIDLSTRLLEELKNL